MSPNAKNVTAESEYMKILLVGSPGTGKSVFASTMPEPGFVFDFSGGILIYRGKDFDYEQYPISAIGWAKYEKDFMQVKKDVLANKYETVVVDDCTGLIDVAMERALSLDPKRNAAGGPLWNVHYQMVRNLIEGKFRQMMAWPCNLVIIAHMDIVKDDETGAVLEIKPFITGQLSVRLPGYFDEVYYTSTTKVGEKVDWWLQTVPIGMKNARSRLSGKQSLLPHRVPNDYAELMKFVQKKTPAPRVGADASVTA